MAANLVLLLLIVAFTFSLGYFALSRVLGSRSARRSLVHAAPAVAIGLLLPLVLAFAGRYGLVALYGLYAAGAVIWMASWPLRKKQAGDLLLRLGNTLQSKVLLWLGLFQVGLAIAITISRLDQFTGSLVTLGGIISGAVELAFWWSLALLFILLGCSRLEIRENGLSYLFAWQPWERIQAFGWDDDKPNTLILKTIPRTFLSRRYLMLSIPADQQQRVDGLLEDYLIEADLDAEMDEKTA
ncbi:hypothetical protein [cf. Phormidesmis sp. LEGE 11477]|uniref:hypothetical protein n=1 Tax=cf. Phormidesmis sp. LEGE 11477 TaxID=1828680 RepID=UPI0018824B75|nr:hypothetical protein [cf. Phormidesmis sp. LEGE 11477]MBE9059716.1 hypothetical protein [cf. Phormidesmis sp. LEGE 11477]